MATEFERAVERFVNECQYVVAVNDLTTKVRIDLVASHVLDLYYNETLGKYSYTLVKAETRILGWDNARHYPSLENFPHHVHQADGKIEPSTLNGAPEHDLVQVRLEVERFLSGLR